MKLTGRVTPPADMVEAARKSLTPAGFDKLMQRVGTRSPTPAELVAAVEEERRDHRTQ